jgi:hypothetical protein
MKHDLHHILQDDNGGTSTGAVVSIAPQALETSTNGTSADLAGYRSCEIIINAGLWTDGTHTFTVQESADNSAFSAVAAADLRGGTTLAVIGTATDNVVALRGYVGNKRYVRVALVTTSATTGLVCGATILRGHKANKGKLNSV